MVEVYNGNSWGVVCSTNWNMKSSQVACRELGFPIVESWNYALPPQSGTGKFLSTSASCNGSENALSQCINPVWKKTSCSGGKVVKLHCSSGMFARCLTYMCFLRKQNLWLADVLKQHLWVVELTEWWAVHMVMDKNFSIFRNSESKALGTFLKNKKSLRNNSMREW